MNISGEIKRGCNRRQGEELTARREAGEGAEPILSALLLLLRVSGSCKQRNEQLQGNSSGENN